MAAQPAPDPMPTRVVPGYAWDWVQRSRPVVERLADVLTGRPPRPGFVQAVRRSFSDDPLVQDAVFGVVADVAFGGRVPTSRPPGTSWDRGLVWWAAALVGRSPADFEHNEAAVDQPTLFGDDDAHTLSRERRALVLALRQVLGASDGGQIPADAVRQLIADLEHQPAPGPIGR